MLLIKSFPFPQGKGERFYELRINEYYPLPKIIFIISFFDKIYFNTNVIKARNKKYGVL